MDHLHLRNRPPQIYVLHCRRITCCVIWYSATFRLRKKAAESHKWQSQEGKKGGLKMGQLNRSQQNNSRVSLNVMKSALRHPRLGCASPCKRASGNVSWKDLGDHLMCITVSSSKVEYQKSLHGINDLAPTPVADSVWIFLGLDQNCTTRTEQDCNIYTLCICRYECPYSRTKQNCPKSDGQAASRAFDRAYYNDRLLINDRDKGFCSHPSQVHKRVIEVNVHENFRGRKPRGTVCMR